MSSRWRYDIRWNLLAKGVVEPKDVVGTLYHETEHLPPRLSLRELEKEEKIDGVSLLGLESQDGVTEGTIRVRCSVELEMAAEIAAALETIDQVGPCEAEIEVKKILSKEGGKKEFIKNRSQELAKKIKSGSGGMLG